jgi:hypothetical protein
MINKARRCSFTGWYSAALKAASPSFTTARAGFIGFVAWFGDLFRSIRQIQIWPISRFIGQLEAFDQWLYGFTKGAKVKKMKHLISQPPLHPWFKQNIATSFPQANFTIVYLYLFPPRLLFGCPVGADISAALKLFPLVYLYHYLMKCFPNICVVCNT